MSRLIISLIAIGAVALTAYTIVSSPNDQVPTDNTVVEKTVPQPTPVPTPDDDGAMMANEDEAMMANEDDQMVEDTMMEGENNDDSGNSDEAKVLGVYTEFTSDVIGNGEESVLFFHATWCPSCKENNGRLNSFLPSDQYVSVYKIDYDASADLKSQFGVIQQDTFIRIDGSGAPLGTTSFPTEEALKAFVAR